MTVKAKRLMLGTAMAAGILMATTVCAAAADYSFSTGAPAGYYGSTVYEEVYGSRYNYGGINLTDYDVPELVYGSFSTTQTGIMEQTSLPGLQAEVASGAGVIYGVSGTSEAIIVPSSADIISSDVIGSIEYVCQETAYTSVDGMELSDGSIGTLTIPTLGISMKVWEGETTTSMAKGVAHYSSTSAWNGNVGLCGHNRGAQYVIGSIKDLTSGDIITYATTYGTRTYEVVTVTVIANTDWSYLQATSDNRITLTTCLADHPESRVCVQAVEI